MSELTVLHLATKLIGHRETYDRFSLYTVGRNSYALLAGRIHAIDPEESFGRLRTRHTNLGKQPPREMVSPQNFRARGNAAHTSKRVAQKRRLREGTGALYPDHRTAERGEHLACVNVPTHRA